jgi:hypothetical protein
MLPARRASSFFSGPCRVTGLLACQTILPDALRAIW